MEINRDAMRDRIEKALRAQAPGDYAKPNNRQDDENDPFLVLRGHHGKEVLFYCDSEVASVEFGPASKHFDFAIEEEEEEEEDIGGPEGFGENMLGESMGGGDEDGEDFDDEEEDEDDDGPGEKALSEEDLKTLIKGIVQTTLDIQTEKVFAAEYKKGFARVARFHSPREFEAVKGMKDFKSVSWKGKYTSG